MCGENEMKKSTVNSQFVTNKQAESEPERKIDKWLVKTTANQSELKRFAILGSFNEKLRFLSGIAEKENWEYEDKKDVCPILFQYIHHTFKRLYIEDKVALYDNDAIAIFNTGLMTPNGEDIYGLFKRGVPNDTREWYLDSFYKASDRALINHRPLPDVADYYRSIFGEKVESYFDANLELVDNIDHILEDRISRMPEIFQNFDLGIQQAILKGAIEKLKKKLKRNPRLAVPQIYDGKLTYLLPLNICDTIVALAVERHDKCYRANTLFTLEMAYTNARLLATPDSNWLASNNRTK